MRLAPLRSTCVYLNINGRHDRRKMSHKLQVNVPRKMGILRDVEHWPEMVREGTLMSQKIEFYCLVSMLL